MWHVTFDKWHVTQDTKHVTHYMWHVGLVNILSKVQLPSSYGLGVKISWRYFHRGWITELISDKLFIGQLKDTHELLSDESGTVKSWPWS